MEQTQSHKIKRTRPTKIEKEIQKAQNSSEHLIPKSCFKRVVEEHLGTKRISRDALFILQEEAEAMIVDKLMKANVLAQSNKRDTVTAEHLALVGLVQNR